MDDTYIGFPLETNFTEDGDGAIPQGADWHFYTGFDYLDSGSGVFEAMDFTGCTARMQIRPDYDSPPLDLELTTENGRIEVGAGGENGWSLALHLTAAATDRGGTYGSAISAFGVGVYDCKVVTPFGQVIRALHGKIAFTRQVTL